MKIILGLIVLSSVALAEPVTQKYPRIVEVKGQDSSVVTGHGDAKFVTKVGVPLIERAHFMAGPMSEITVELDENIKIVILSSSEVEFPGIRPEDGAVPLVELKSGRLRWTGLRLEADRILRSDFFSLNPGVGDFVFRSEKKPPQAEVQCLSGELDFSGTNAEDVAHVKKGQRAVFVGALEDGEVAYDLLLKGKKIPRGQLLPVQKVPESELRSYDEERLKMESAVRKEKARLAQLRLAEAKAGFVCVGPKGKFNDCAVLCEGNPRGAKKCHLEQKGVHCVRRRCNANGLWAETTELSSEDAQAICQATPVVSACP